MGSCLDIHFWVVPVSGTNQTRRRCEQLFKLNHIPMNHTIEAIEKMIQDAKLRLANPDLSADSVSAINRNIREWQQEIERLRTVNII